MAVSGTSNGISTRALTALADTLQIDLDVSPSGSIFGGDKFKMAVPAIGLKGRLDVKVDSNFASANGEDCGLLVKVAGDLALYLFASDFDSTVKVMVIDASKLKKNVQGYFESQSIRSWRSSMNALGSAIVAAYERDFNGGTYTKITAAL